MKNLFDAFARIGSTPGLNAKEGVAAPVRGKTKWSGDRRRRVLEK